MFSKTLKARILKVIFLFILILPPVVLACLGYIKPELAVVFVALTLGILGVFQDWIRSKFYYPELDIRFDVKPPDCHKTSITFRNTNGTVTASADCYYYRLKISNVGNYRAEKIEVMITEKYAENREGRFVKDENFLPLNLKWSHDRVIVRESIASSLFRYCDLGYVIHPDYKEIPLKGFNIKGEGKTVLDLDVEVKPNTGSHLVFPGKYRVKVIAVADNSKVFSKIFEIHFRDFWHNDEGTMLKAGLTVNEVPSLT